ncbi:mycofactocin system transcriptional regulator [Rhodococcoides fascians]|jgi:mycofactocin system transcriptional regulator|uniref:mycofactocin system transcriptional regulator n=1 Tax=Rhodococcoides fascians TaxID=1828 RepID=UPI000B9B7761|nr:mycofactocin system transcriptional regulator [Rhodococcus fascians]OZE83241.1 mycofactocin system transcriptional regulator [Rhodococcus fascians]OZF10514.1 mycofactocin system transcriptional regulator [Rhodococcus fascians]OZF13552.1 mycofactocin system transcriptional regulator [Rhodococcus fascians]OZF60460.1 mycofactocin system transcriptional regulator [Rhodococcus fascians]OZF61941.1 mycofactocin system transcriptional regulator [Rhodococcus fascians]
MVEQEPPGPLGRPQSTTKGVISDIAIGLFATHGFDSTSVDDIAEAAGIARRTFFRYFPSKNAVPWGDFEAGLSVLRHLFAKMPTSTSVADAVMAALLQFNSFPHEEREVHRTRMRLIFEVPALQGYSMVMYQGWRAVIAEFVAVREGLVPTDLYPRTAGWLALGIAVSAYEQWLADDDADLADLLRQAAEPLFLGLQRSTGSTSDGGVS